MTPPVSARFLGLDLAWSDRNRSGLAALDESGRVIDAGATLRSDEEILAWVRRHLAALGPAGVAAIGVDMPTIVRNAAGRRACEAELQAVFARAHAGPHPANLARFPDGGRARRLLDALTADGVVERCDLAVCAPGRVAFEVFPHPSLVRLFDRPRIFRAKKKPRRSWETVLAEWSLYRDALASLTAADPPLRLPAGFPDRVDSRGYKRWDDTIDAIACAYIASFVWRWGTAAPHVRVYGDLADGYVVVPDRRVTAPPAGYGAFVEPAPDLDRKVFSMSSATVPKPKTKANDAPFLSDVTTLRERARQQVEKGAVVPTYEGDVEQTIEILQSVLATEIVCVLRYTMHYVAAEGISSDSVKAEFLEHAREEQEHMMAVAERINQLNGTPNFNPDGLSTRSASQYAEGGDLVGMIKENLIAERIAVEHYQELVRFFGDRDITTRVMLEGILAVEEEHASDMHDLLVAHEGRPFIKGD